MRDTVEELQKELDATPCQPTPSNPDRDYTPNDLALLIRRAELRLRLHLAFEVADLARFARQEAERQERADLARWTR